jgi:hypothetical protein
MQAYHFEFLAHRVGHRGIAQIGDDDRRAIGGKQGKELEAGWIAGAAGKAGSRPRTDRFQIGNTATAEACQLFVVSKGRDKVVRVQHRHLLTWRSPGPAAPRTMPRSLFQTSQGQAIKDNHAISRALRPS